MKTKYALSVLIASIAVATTVAATSIYQQPGGRIMKPAKGMIALVNTQNTVSIEPLVREAHGLFDSFFLPLKEADAQISSVADFSSVMKTLGADVALFIIDDPALPMTLIAVEEGWGLVNVAPLRKDEPSSDKLISRLQKLETRTFLNILGASYSPGKGSVMCAVSSTKDLDEIRDTSFEPTYTVNMMMYAQTRGIVPSKMVSYEKACQEGWAPAPTNDLQRAIWEEVHAIPQKPMKIEFDPKQGR